MGDDAHARDVFDKKDVDRSRKYPVVDKELVSRVESHCIALKRKAKDARFARNQKTSLKIFTALNGLKREDILKDLVHVGVVQTPINPVSPVLCA